MKSLLFLFGALVLAGVSGCTLTRGSHVAIGARRAPTDPAGVVLYTRPPAKYEELGPISADARNGFASPQTLMDAAIARLKIEAARIGANGVLLMSAGDQAGGTIGMGFGNAQAYGTAYGATAFGSSTGIGVPIINKAASGMAIYVTQP